MPELGRPCGHLVRGLYSRAATVRADTELHLIYLARVSFNKLLGSLVDILTRDTTKYDSQGNLLQEGGNA